MSVFFAPTSIAIYTWRAWQALHVLRAPMELSQLYIVCEPDKIHWGWSWLVWWIAATWRNGYLAILLLLRMYLMATL
jgi:hypothetical protein